MLLGSRLDKGKQDNAKTWNMDQYLLFLFWRGNSESHFQVSGTGSWTSPCRSSKCEKWEVQTISEGTYKQLRRSSCLVGKGLLGLSVGWQMGFCFILFFVYVEMYFLTNKADISWQCQLMVKGRFPLLQRFPKERCSPHVKWVVRDWLHWLTSWILEVSVCDPSFISFYAFTLSPRNFSRVSSMGIARTGQ